MLHPHFLRSRLCHLTRIPGLDRHALARRHAVHADQHATATLHALTAYDIQNIVTSPGGLLQLLRMIERHPGFNSRLETVFSGGSILPASLSERVRMRICSDLFAAYGSTEMGMVASAPAQAIAALPAPSDMCCRACGRGR